ncbi:MAG: glycosyltransferase family 2 protein [Planctomycetes bacterium]|nr:glycosyltransferase family 2 protein [Planctomycetota bacterium]
MGNLLAALQRVRHDKVVFVEDDDWYAPEYLAQMVRWLDQTDLVGETGARYYHLPTRRHHLCGASCPRGVVNPASSGIALAPR